MLYIKIDFASLLAWSGLSCARSASTLSTPQVPPLPLSDASRSRKIKSKVLLNFLGLVLHLGGTPLVAIDRGIQDKAPIKYSCAEYFFLPY